MRQLPDPEREAAIASACGGDTDLEGHLRSLLGHLSDDSLFTSPDDLPPDPVGGSLGGIRILAKIGEGGMGVVYRGFDERLRRNVALKSIRGEWSRHPEARARFVREARVLGQLRHPGICEIYGYEQGADVDYLVIELLDGQTLTKLLAAPVRRAEADRIAQALADVLAAAHRAGVIHRDLKPENVMITEAGAVKVLDFGIARVDTDEPDGPVVHREGLGAIDPGARAGETRAGSILGTPRYMSPEQARAEPVTPASDVYALGLILHELYTGQPVHPRGLGGIALLGQLRAGEVHVDRARLPSGRRTRLIERMLAPDPLARPTAAAVVAELAAIRALPRRTANRVVVSALLLLATVGAVRYVVDVRAARNQAEAARGQAERLVNVLLDEVYDDVYIRQRRNVVARVSDETIRYFEELPVAERDKNAHRLALALRHDGILKAQQGHYPEAEAELGRAADLARAAAARAADPTVALSDEAYAVGLMVFGPRARSDFSREVEVTEQALTLYKRVASLHPDDDKLRDRMAFQYGDVGWACLDAGCDARAGSVFEESVAIYRQLLPHDPTSVEWRFRIAVHTAALGDLAWFGGRRAEGDALYAEAATIYSRLAEEDPATLNHAGFLAELQLSQARSLREAGHLDEALALVQRARRVLEKNHATDPERTRWIQSILDASVAELRVLRRMGREAEGLAQLARVAETSRAIRELYLGHASWAEAMLELGRVDEAREDVTRLYNAGWARSATHATLTELVRRDRLWPLDETAASAGQEGAAAATAK